MGEGGGRRRSRVPTGRLERLARMGALAGEIAAGGVAESVRRLTGGASDGGLFITEGNGTYSIDASGQFTLLSGLGGCVLTFGDFGDGPGPRIFLSEGITCDTVMLEKVLDLHEDSYSKFLVLSYS